MEPPNMIKIPLADPLINEKEAFAAYQVIKSGWIREGPLVRKFEERFAKYIGVRHAVAVSSGTAALHVALSCLGLKHGDEVILPSFTCAPPISMTLLIRAVPALVDIEDKTYNIDPACVERMITKRTRAVIPIDYAGCPAEMDALREVAERHGIYLVEDGAEALGGTYKGRKVGNFGELCTFSFSPNKTITTGEGGMIVTNNEALAEKARVIKDYGQDVRFHYVELGHNYHMTEFQAAIGLQQLSKIDTIVNRKRENARLLTEKLSAIDEIVTPNEVDYATHVYTLYSIRTRKANTTSRYRLEEELTKAGIQTRLYFPPVHTSPFLQRFKFRRDKLINTERVASTILSIPSTPKLSHQDIEYIYKTIDGAMQHA